MQFEEKTKSKGRKEEEESRCKPKQSWWYTDLFLLGLYRILALPKTGNFYESGSGFFCPGLQNGAYKYCSVLYFCLVLKNCAVDIAIFSIRLFTLLRSRHVATDEILHYEYCKYLSSLRSFVIHDQITNPSPAGFVLSNLAKYSSGRINKTWIWYSPTK